MKIGKKRDNWKKNMWCSSMFGKCSKNLVSLLVGPYCLFTTPKQQPFNRLKEIYIYISEVGGLEFFHDSLGLKKKVVNKKHGSGQIIIFHQPRFPWNKRISPTKSPFGVRSCEVAIIWPDGSFLSKVGVYWGPFSASSHFTTWFVKKHHLSWYIRFWVLRSRY